MNIKGKVVESVEFCGEHGVKVLFTDKSYLHIALYEDCAETHMRLIEPTLTNDVVPVGANSLGEGSV